MISVAFYSKMRIRVLFRNIKITSHIFDRSIRFRFDPFCGVENIEVNVINAESPFHRLPKNCAQQESAQRHAHTKWSGSLCSVDVAEQKNTGDDGLCW